MKLFARYIGGLYLRVTAGVLAVSVLLLFVLNFFDKIGGLLEHDAPAGAMTAYFALKSPTLVNEVFPAAALLSVMLTIGLLTRTREVLALTAAGVSSRQIAAPVLLASAALSFAMFCWNDFVVPPTAARSRFIRDNLIRNQDAVGIRGPGSVWLQDGSTFVTAGFYDPENAAIYDLSLYETDANFHVTRIVEIPQARWSAAGGWTGSAGIVKSIQGETAGIAPLAPGPVPIGIEPRAFDKRVRKAKEMTYGELSHLLDEMRRRSVDSDALAVDLSLKLAWPFSGFVTAAIGLPLALRSRKRGGPAFNVAVAFALAFAYWITFAVSIAAGKSGSIPPILAAWAPNVLFLGAGLALRQDIGGKR